MNADETAQLSSSAFYPTAVDAVRAPLDRVPVYQASNRLSVLILRLKSYLSSMLEAV